MTVPEEAPRGMAVPETPSAKEREGHELTHVPSQSWCSVCARATGVDARHLRRLAGERAEDQGVDHLPVIQFDYVHVSSGDSRGQQVKMRKHWRWHFVCDERERCRRQVRDFFCGVVLERTGVHTVSMQDRSRASDQNTRGCCHQMFGDDRAVEQVLPEETIPESHASLGALEGWHFCRDTSELCDWTLRGETWVSRWCYAAVVTVACESRVLAAERISEETDGATASENLKRVSCKKSLLQFGERWHWLEAERITHKYDPRWGIGVSLGRHTASAHLIGTLRGVIQARTVRRLTREQR